VSASTAAAARPVGHRAHVAGAFVYLTLHTARNRLAARARRLKHPRYALALAVGVFYFWFLFFRRDADAPLSGVVGGEWSALVGSLFFAGLTTNWWLFGGSRGALAFSPAEVQFLFPAPVSRRALIHFKLLRAQSFILVNTLLWVGLLGRGRTELNSGLRALALWVLFSTLHLHRLGASLVHASAFEHGQSGARRGVLPLAVFVAAFLALAWGLMQSAPALQEAWEAGLPAFLSAAGHALQAPVPSAVLAPFRALLAPGLATTAVEWARAMVPALGIMLLNYAWVMYRDAAFEEAAVEESARRAARLSAPDTGRPGEAAPFAVRAGRRVTRFPLSPTGNPAAAIFWKNLVAVTRAVRPSLVVIPLGAGAVAMLIVLATQPEGTALTHSAGVLLTSWAGLLIATGPLWVRYDLRQDLPKLEMLRSYPISGWSVVTAEIAASTAILSAFQMSLLALAYLAYLGDTTLTISLGERTVLLAALALALPAVNAVGLTVQNAAALFFPAWIRLGATRAGGVEAMGQGLITIIASLAVVCVLLLLPGTAGAALAYALRPLLGSWALAPALVLAVAATFAELVPITRWLGRVFERTDPTAVNPT
jgi:ABC-2 type transport system permease protein